MHIQSIIIPKFRFTRTQADMWIEKNGYIKRFENKVDESANYYRYRQRVPKKGANYIIKNFLNRYLAIYN